MSSEGEVRKEPGTQDVGSLGVSLNASEQIQPQEAMRENKDETMKTYQLI